MLTNADAPIYLTTGEPSGIGPDLVLMLAHNGSLTLKRVWVALADTAVLKQRSQMLGFTTLLTPYTGQQHAAPIGSLYILHIPEANTVKAGQLNSNNAAHVLLQLHTASTAALTGKAAAIVTAPVHKAIINAAGIAFSGHTEYFQQQAGVAKVVMMLSTSPSNQQLRPLRVALATTHLPLKDVPRAITPQLLTEVIHILNTDLKNKLGISNPRILVCGLNPHAGEDGYLGQEEIDIINPTIAQLQAAGINLSLAMPADTLFTPRNLQDADAILSMYHDQGLPVLKALGFGEAINITLGLPYIRTSVDHGTALDLAGTGKASSSSLRQALLLADSLISSSLLYS